MPTCKAAASPRRAGEKRIRHGPPKPTLPAIRRAVLAILAPPRPIDALTAREPSVERSNESAKVVLGLTPHEQVVEQHRAPRVVQAKRGFIEWRNLHLGPPVDHSLVS